MPNGTNPMDTADKEQLKLERLQSTLNRAYKNVPFHRKRFESHNLTPQAIGALEDIEKLPFMKRADLGLHYPYGLFAVPLRDIVRIHTAPGTGDRPSISGYTQADLLIWKKLVARSLNACGVTDMDILQIHLPAGLANWGRDYKDGGELLGASVIPNSMLSLSKTLMVLRDYKTTTLVTTLAFAEQLTDHMFERERHPNELNLKRIILVGEPVTKDIVKDLEARLHADIWQHYGLSEIPGPAIAHECGDHCGLHICDDHILPEIIDPATGQTLPAGTAGELVLTTLSARALPLVRFRTGDMARLITEPCGCGSPFIRMEWLTERADDYMIISGIKVSQEQTAVYLKQALGISDPDCDMERIRLNGTEALGISLVLDDALFSDEIKNLEQLMFTTERSLTENLGVPVTIRLMQKRN
ncbi:MAG TPA: phenylacetate--CoA ligase [Desulfobacteraceae bacterium]|nr:phenylacetate--CoA ligase [Desulfobacteraceae bacterium]|tara:strand:+ start:1103 stop:2347 length:1245 start_codon:yes stop_codon:yes gene_type:complete